MDDLLVEKVLRAVELIPVGRVVSYGDIAGLVGTSPRRVGAIMRDYGSGVTWWRVVSSSGDLPSQLGEQARAQWAAEGIAWKPNGLGCRIASHRADLPALAAAWQHATTDLATPGAAWRQATTDPATND